jgi:transcriptional regulator
MYSPAPFTMTNPADAAAFVAAHPFALVCVNGPEGPVAAHVPLVAGLDGQGHLATLSGHVARANPVWQQVGAGAPVLVVFRGPDAYVSPSAYPSKAAHGKVVPTWNYVAAEARGIMTVEPDPARMDPYIVAPTEMMEATRDRPWAVHDAPQSYVDAMKRAIVGIHITVTGLTAKQKLSQNKDDADFSGVATDLSNRSDPSAQAIAALMTDQRA